MSDCVECARKDTEFCIICSDDDFFITKEDLDYQKWLCDMMCSPCEED